MRSLPFTSEIGVSLFLASCDRFFFLFFLQHGGGPTGPANVADHAHHFFLPFLRSLSFLTQLVVFLILTLPFLFLLVFIFLFCYSLFYFCIFHLIFCFPSFLISLFLLNFTFLKIHEKILKLRNII